MTAEQYKLARELGLCTQCNEPAVAGRARCAVHAAKNRAKYKPKATTTCSACAKAGHNSRTCPVIAELDAKVAAMNAALTPPKHPFEWEERAKKRAAIDKKLIELIATDSLLRAKAIAKEIRRML